MVDALREAHRVLTAPGTLLDVRPLTLPIVVEVIAGSQTEWARTIQAYSVPEDISAADAAMEFALSQTWFAAAGTSLAFEFVIEFDSADEFKAYVDDRKLCGAEIPYAELEKLRVGFSTTAEGARLRCRRPWKLDVYRNRR